MDRAGATAQFVVSGQNVMVVFGHEGVQMPLDGLATTVSDKAIELRRGSTWFLLAPLDGQDVAEAARIIGLPK